MSLDDLGIEMDNSASSESDNDEEEEKHLMDDSALYEPGNHPIVFRYGPHIEFQEQKKLTFEFVPEPNVETPRNSLTYRKTPSYRCEDVEVRFDPQRTSQKPDLARSNSFSHVGELEKQEKEDDKQNSSSDLNNENPAMTPSRRKNRESIPTKIHSNPTKRESNNILKSDLIF